MMKLIRITPRLAFTLLCCIILSSSIWSQGRGRIIETRPIHENKTEPVSVDPVKLRPGEVREELIKRLRIKADAQKTSVLRNPVFQIEDATVFVRSVLGSVFFSTNFKSTSSIIQEHKVENSLASGLEDYFKGVTAEELFEKVRFIVEYDIEVNDRISQFLENNPKKVLLQLPDNRFAPVKIQNGRIFYKNEDYFLERKGVDDYFRAKEELYQPVENKNNIIVSLINDDATTTGVLQRNFSNTIFITAANHKQFKNILTQNRSSRIFIIGHCQEGKFISFDRKKGREFEIDMREIEDFSSRNNILVHNLGCESIKNNSSIGFAEEINSIKLINSLNGVMNSKSMNEFFNSLSRGTGVYCYITREFLNNNSRYTLSREKEKAAAEKEAGSVFNYVTTTVNSPSVPAETAKDDGQSESPGFFKIIGNIILVILVIGAAIFLFSKVLFPVKNK